jgi:hypothetical protein
MSDQAAPLDRRAEELVCGNRLFAHDASVIGGSAVGLTCLVTLHGIGFQQPPSVDPPRPGYADQLHTALSAELGGRLGHDPERADTAGPVYVQSDWRGVRDDGLARLGRPLVRPGADVSVAHVVLVYAASELDGYQPLGAVLDTLARTISNLHRYVSLRALARRAWLGLRLLLPARRSTTGSPTAQPTVPSLTPRSDTVHPRRPLASFWSPLPPAGTLGLLAALEQDVAGYVFRNELRERLRSFVQDALTQLAGRPDVDQIVLNTHSQGTVLAVDVLARNMPATTTAVLTFGSPLRKYVELYGWGDRVGHLAELWSRGGRWVNVYDPTTWLIAPRPGSRPTTTGTTPSRSSP